MWTTLVILIIFNMIVLSRFCELNKYCCLKIYQYLAKPNVITYYFTCWFDFVLIIHSFSYCCINPTTFPQKSFLGSIILVIQRSKVCVSFVVLTWDDIKSVYNDLFSYKRWSLWRILESLGCVCATYRLSF